MQCSGSRAELDADRFLAIRDGAVRASVLANLRDELLGPGDRRDLTLVVTDWPGRMPEEVRAILRELFEQGSSNSRWRLTGLDLHGRVGWFVELLALQRQAFESPSSSMQSLELSLVDEEASTTTCVDALPRFGNLRTLRIYQPEFGDSQTLAELLRDNLVTLAEFACVARSSAVPFISALRELDSPHRGERETSLWLRGREALVTEALDMLGAAIARDRGLEEHTA